MANFSNDTSTSLVSKSTYPSSLDSLFIMHKKRIFNYINSKIKDVDVSNDILQETFIKVFKVLKNGKYVEKGKFLSWVLRISHNLIMDYFRNKKRSKIIFEKDLNCLIANMNCGFEQKQKKMLSDETIRKVLSKMIDTLPHEQKEIVNLRFFQNYSFREIAEINNISINTALGRVRYSIINLKNEMKKSIIKNELQNSY